MVWRNDQVSQRETEKILETARQCLAVEGDFVEMGCYRGDTSILLAEILHEAQKSGLGERLSRGSENSSERGNLMGDCSEKGELGKKLWLYDSFEGLPEKGAEDESATGVEFQRGALLVSKREVKARFLRSGLAVPKIVKGRFADLTEADLPGKISFAFLDGDLYESIRDCLRLVGPKMADGGVILVHDYQNPALPGVTKAVDEFMDGGNNRGGEIERFETLAAIRR